VNVFAITIFKAVVNFFVENKTARKSIGWVVGFILGYIVGILAPWKAFWIWIQTPEGVAVVVTIIGILTGGSYKATTEKEKRLLNENRYNKPVDCQNP
jgi:hypothetical protein